MRGLHHVPSVQGAGMKRSNSMACEGTTVWTWLMLCCGLSLAACGGSASERVPGGRSESCNARADCETGLACFDNRCEPSDQRATTKSDAGVVTPVETRGGLGESCTRRADCSVGLGCVANVCVEGTAPAEPHVLGERGESCRARNDCAEGLSCIAEHCTPDKLSVEVQPKQCVRVQCEKELDCCANFVAQLSCPMLKESCTGGDTAACSTFNGVCVCGLQCNANTCVAVRKCSSDSECGTGNHCQAGKCVECSVDTDCSVSGQHCVTGACRAGCERDEQCPLFSECKSGECVDVGCKSDRACYFATKDVFSRCREGRCESSCTSDAQCPALSACKAERCVFVGCETDTECRALLGLANQPGTDQARCQLPDR
jgi:hypothetical protein